MYDSRPKKQDILQLEQEIEYLKQKLDEITDPTLTTLRFYFRFKLETAYEKLHELQQKENN